MLRTEPKHATFQAPLAGRESGCKGKLLCQETPKRIKQKRIYRGALFSILRVSCE